MFQHGFFVLVGQKFRRIALTSDLHDFKRHIGIKPLLDQIDHDAVAGTNHLRNCAGAVFD